MSSLISYLNEGGADFIRTALIEGAIAGIFSAAGIAAVALRARHEWRSAQFKDRINISVNIVTENTLRIRTVLEDQVRTVILSTYAQKLLKQSMQRTTEEDEFLHFPTDRDAWLVYNEIINAISEQCGPHLLIAAGRQAAYSEVPFLLALTYERTKDVRIQKFRVLLVQEAVLEHISTHTDANEIGVEVEYQRQRLRTLAKMYERFKKNKWPAYQIIALPTS